MPCSTGIRRYVIRDEIAPELTEVEDKSELDGYNVWIVKTFFLNAQIRRTPMGFIGIKIKVASSALCYADKGRMYVYPIVLCDQRKRLKHVRHLKI